MTTSQYIATLGDEFINQAGALFQLYRVTGPDGTYTIGRVRTDKHSAWMIRSQDGRVIKKNSARACQIIHACLHYDPALGVA